MVGFQSFCLSYSNIKKMSYLNFVPVSSELKKVVRGQAVPIDCHVLANPQKIDFILTLTHTHKYDRESPFIHNISHIQTFEVGTEE